MIPTGVEHSLTTLLVVFDLAGTFVFALSGATKAVQHRLDFLAFWCCASRRETRAASPGMS